MHHLVLPPDPRSVRRARSFARDSIEGHTTAPADVAVLLTSELVTNAVLHAEGPVQLSVRVADTSVRVEVADQSARPPVLREPVDPFAAHGRGMQLVERLSTRWGVSPTPTGKQVWFELQDP